MNDQEEIHLSGLPVSEGVALAKVRFMQTSLESGAPVYLVSSSRIEQEVKRLETALERAGGSLDIFIGQVRQRIGEARANIFVAQRMMLEDPVLLEQFRALIREQRINAEAAVLRTLEGYEALLAEVDDEYLRERSTDIVELRRRILEHLLPTVACQQKNPPLTGTGMWIVVAEELTPSETMALDTAHTAGFITERGGPGSHVAILARALGIPAVTGIKRPQSVFAEGQMVLLNGITGEVTVRPSERTLRLYPAPDLPPSQTMRVVPPVEGFTVLANIALATDLGEAETAEAEGIGLYRTEFEMFAAGRLLSEDEQYERYVQVARRMRGKPLYIRLADFGSDKPAPFLPQIHEENPCLGLRGSRLLMTMPELLETQARAIARASVETPICAIYPMIVDPGQFLRLRAMVQQYASEYAGAQITHAVMFEVPSACLAAEELLAVADAGCIGTNDLIQYLFAVDRNNEHVAGDYHPDRDVLWKILGDLARIADRAGKPLSLCGEIGAQPEYVPRLIETGIHRVSVSPRMIGLARVSAARYFRQQRRAGGA